MEESVSSPPSVAKILNSLKVGKALLDQVIYLLPVNILTFLFSAKKSDLFC